MKFRKLCLIKYVYILKTDYSQLWILYKRDLCISFAGKYELDINVYILKTDYSQLWILYKRDLRISFAGKYEEIIRT